ncbi:hypothetical protein AT15_00740 [Kosmotoga arenicorallina S304]|uniref:PBS lyase n=1 Tax=Kosmotoga arenicorallina S304 TaxID=1453497 RepID=A0A176K0B6_9BACT|nr:hypothetical protein [Kosmotoga arenicorallina]OAA30073.1 hypothetical protein AT15_00740 [Kosmotoga arenicorallina S304]
MDRNELIRKIVEEKGAEAIPILLELLRKEDDATAQICLDALAQIGEEGRMALINELKRIVKEGIMNDITALYIADRLGDLHEKRAASTLYSLLQFYDDENAQVVIYEALAKLGEGERVVDVLTLFLEEGENQEFIDQLIMALSHTKSIKALKALVKLYSRENLDRGTKAFILEGIQMLVMDRPEFKEVLGTLEKGDEILEKLYLWRKENRGNGH